MDRQGAVTPVTRAHEPPLVALFLARKQLLLVARLEAVALGQDPDLQQVRLLVLGVIELAVQHARAGRHALHFAGPDDRAVAHAVLVLERTVDHVGDDLHVTMRMGSETLARLDPVLVDDAQFRKTHHLGVVVVSERERVLRLEPAVVGAAACIRTNDVDHVSLQVRLRPFAGVPAAAAQMRQAPAAPARPPQV